MNLRIQKIKDVQDIVECLLNGKKAAMYSPAVREFALTMNYHSARAYRYLRQKFKNRLPNPSTLQNWYVNSGASGEPGISTQCSEYMKTMAANAKESNRTLYCSLAFDEMAIRHHVQYIDSQKKFNGFITYGIEKNETPAVATNNIMFMANMIKEPISLPLAHHFISTLSIPNLSLYVI